MAAAPVSTPQPVVAPKPVAVAAPNAPDDVARPPGKPVGTAEPPAATSIRPEPSLPLSMRVRPADGTEPLADRPARQFAGELPESFAEALARVEPLPARSRRSGRWRRLFSPAASRPESSRRVVAFDGFRSDLYDEKLERDRRYGTVYSVTEEQNAYLVRLEMPRRLAFSALRATWNLPAEMPDYDYTLALVNGVLTVKASVPGEALRRLSYVSTSFPADFMTRIEFSRPVDGFVHRLRDKVLEIIVFKRVLDRERDQGTALRA